MKTARVRPPWLFVCVLAVTLPGCTPAIVPFAVWLGQVVLYTAAVRASVQLVDQFLAQKSRNVSSEVVPSPGDPNRGTLPSLTVGRPRPDGNPSMDPNEQVTFTNVPMVRSYDGRWIVEKYYCDTVMDPHLKSIK